LVIHSSGTGEGTDRPDFWDFPKGLLEPGEKGIDAVRREAREEVGIEEFEIVEGFKETVRYFTRREGKPVPKFVAMFLGESKTDEVELSWEHDQYAWQSYEGAYKKITLPQMRDVLKSVVAFLKTSS